MWRWILIAAELLVVAYLVGALMAGRAARHPSGAFLVIGIAAFVAWVSFSLAVPFWFGRSVGLLFSLVHRGHRAILVGFTMTTRPNHARACVKTFCGF